MIHKSLASIDPQELEQLEFKLRPLVPDGPYREEFIRTYYLPLLSWILAQLKELPQRPLMIGINGPQGSGKSTMTRLFVSLLKDKGFNGVTLSIDDFYLKRVDQVELARKYVHNPLLQQRGYPGTHDVTLGVQTLQALRCLQAGQTVHLPKYDKSLHQGQGDRAPESEWNKVTGPLDFVFLEGWMLGFRPATENQALLYANPNLREINAFLEPYSEWDKFLDVFIHLIPKKISQVRDWRIEAEERMKAQGKPGMTREEITAYIEKFLPAYELYVPLLKQNPPLRDKSIRITLDAARLSV